MDLPWGLTTTSGHLSIYTNDEIATLSKLPTTDYFQKIKDKSPPSSPSSRSVDKQRSWEKRKEKRRNNKKDTRRKRVNKRLSKCSWGGLELNFGSVHSSEEFNLLESHHHARQLPPDKPTTGGTDRCSFNRQSSWGMLEINTTSHHHRAEKFSTDAVADAVTDYRNKTKHEGNGKRRPSRNSWGDLDLAVSSQHSKSSWAGLDILLEIERIPSAADEQSYHLESEEDSSEHNSFHLDENLLLRLALQQNGKSLVNGKHEQQSASVAKEIDTQDNEEGENDGKATRHRCWIDFELDELSESESESGSDDDDEETWEEADRWDSSDDDDESAF